MTDSALVLELKRKIEKACKLIFDELEDTVVQVKDYESPNIRDDYDKMHLQLLFFSATERELSHLYRQAYELKRQVDTHLARSREILKDAEMVAVEDKGFKVPNTYTSRVETEARLRSKTFEELYDVRIWERLVGDVNYLLEVIKSHQMDAFKSRRDIDTRIKLKDIQVY